MAEFEYWLFLACTPSGCWRQECCQRLYRGRDCGIFHDLRKMSQMPCWITWLIQDALLMCR